MIIGIPKETKIGENRVAATPSGVDMLVEAGHRVLVENGAGNGSGFSDGEYLAAGAELVPSAADAWSAEMVIKIKEPIDPEFTFLHDDLVLFTYLHLASPGLEKLTRALMDKGVTALAYETVQLPEGALPLLEPMSEVSGRMAMQIAARYLEKTHGGRGILISGVPGVSPGNVVIIGAGTVGWNATLVALGMGANVTVINRGITRLRHLVETLGTSHTGSLTTITLSPHSLEEALQDADVVVGAVLSPGRRAPILVSRDMIRAMKPGSVIVDIDIDQGGIFETARPTTHEDPIYVEEGVIHYCVTNIPGAVPRTSTIALTNATRPYALDLANLGFIDAVKSDSALAKGVNVYNGQITNKGVAEAHGLEYRPLNELI
jgi:alanine dehydrogenase